MANPIRATAESLRGMGVTLKNFFRKPVTVQYPEQVRKLPPRTRGRHVLHRYETGLERCIACMLCSGTCPAGWREAPTRHGSVGVFRRRCS